MNICVEIGHPGSVHLFKHVISRLVAAGHKVFPVCLDKDITIELMKKSGFDYHLLSNDKYNSKPVQYISSISSLFKYSVQNKIDFFLSRLSPLSAIVSSLLLKKNYAFADTEHAKLSMFFSLPFVTRIYTPDCFLKDLGRNHIRYPGYHELAYLHPNYYIPDKRVLQKYGLSLDEQYSIVRLSSWDAAHDLGQRGIEKVDSLIRNLKNIGRVVVSTQKDGNNLQRYSPTAIEPQDFHSLLYYASLCVSEGATTATEAALLGTPSLYISSLSGSMGNLIDLNKYGLLFSFDNEEDALDYLSNEFVLNSTEWEHKRSILLKDKIDVVSYIAHQIEQGLL